MKISKYYIFSYIILHFLYQKKKKKANIKLKFSLNLKFKIKVNIKNINKKYKLNIIPLIEY